MRVVKDPLFVSVTIWLTDLAMEGRPHSVLSSLVLCKRPCESTVLSRTSTPKTLVFMGLGYFCMAALVTVSHGWLCDKKNSTLGFSQHNKPKIRYVKGGTRKSKTQLRRRSTWRQKSDLSSTFLSIWNTNKIKNCFVYQIIIIHVWSLKNYGNSQNEGTAKRNGWRNAPPRTASTTIPDSWNYLEAGGGRKTNTSLVKQRRKAKCTWFTVTFTCLERRDLRRLKIPQPRLWQTVM